MVAPISSFYNSLLCLVARTGGASLVKCNNEYEIWHSQTEYTYQVYTLAIVAKDLIVVHDVANLLGWKKCNKNTSFVNFLISTSI